MFLICPGRARHFGIGSAHSDVDTAVKARKERRGAWKEDVGVIRPVDSYKKQDLGQCKRVYRHFFMQLIHIISFSFELPIAHKRREYTAAEKPLPFLFFQIKDSFC